MEIIVNGRRFEVPGCISEQKDQGLGQEPVCRKKCTAGNCMWREGGKPAAGAGLDFRMLTDGMPGSRFGI